ncbi:hypothetical protein RDI58_024075 [Solanum bulbocastanum]|uniref:Uncharacterized protein n=1 Tax=Solanum bulbocastanum TaxID=147425 RepID=A0AAN8Y591_SOLBU
MLQAIHRSHRKPWLVLGDFTVILHAEDRIGDNPISLTDVVDFATCIDDCGLIEHPHQDNQYTWSDKGGEARIYSKIDWALINDEWLTTMP